MLDARDREFATDVLNASLTLMSILVAVITILAVEYKGHQGDAKIATPIYIAVMGTAGASVFAGLLALLALFQLRSGRVNTTFLTWAFAGLILIMTLGIVYVVSALMA